MRRTATGLVAIAAVLAATMAPVSAQVGGANPAFEGRPAMAGAQAGTGAVAGPPQGGLGPQGSGGDSGLTLRRTGSADVMGAPAAQVPGGPALPTPSGPGGPSGPAVPRDPGMDRPGNSGEIKPRPSDSGIAKESRSAASKARRIVKTPRD